MTERGELCRILYMGEMTMEKVYDNLTGSSAFKTSQAKEVESCE